MNLSVHTLYFKSEKKNLDNVCFLSKTLSCFMFFILCIIKHLLLSLCWKDQGRGKINITFQLIWFILMLLMFHKLTHKVSNGPKLFQIVWKGLKWLHMVPNGPKWFWPVPNISIKSPHHVLITFDSIRVKIKDPEDIFNFICVCR